MCFKPQELAPTDWAKGKFCRDQMFFWVADFWQKSRYFEDTLVSSDQLGPDTRSTSRPLCPLGPSLSIRGGDEAGDQITVKR